MKVVPLPEEKDASTKPASSFMRAAVADAEICAGRLFQALQYLVMKRAGYWAI